MKKYILELCLVVVILVSLIGCAFSLLGHIYTEVKLALEQWHQLSLEFQAIGRDGDEEITYDTNEETPLLLAIYSNDVERVRSVVNAPGFDASEITAGPDPSKNYGPWTPSTPLAAACNYGNYEIIKLLLNQKGVTAAYVEGTAWAPLMRAVSSYQQDDYKTVQLLLERGAEVNIVNGWQTPIDVATSMSPYRGLYEYNEEVGEGIVQVVGLLLDNGADTDGHSVGLDYLLLDNAATAGNIALVNYLIVERGFDVNQRNERGQTALIRLTWYLGLGQNDAAMAELLLQHGADKNIRDNRGLSAYDYAMKKEGEDLAGFLKPTRYWP
ncbi:MAG: ankyrin repeat domain-containing protein [Christensenellaceae bacterium]|jgi:ankyrin repeat protein|nr:ankyrin repeat domain-containing protein [Christensenellaceae bacterium]